MDLECDARFRCPACGKEVAANVLLPHPAWLGDSKATPEVEVITIECPLCKESFAGRALVRPNLCSLEFIDDPLTQISASPPMVRDDGDWDDYDPPLDPYSIFNASLHEAGVLLDERGGGGTHLINRMVFAHFIGAFEAFLVDTLINKVLANEDAMKRLIAGDAQLRARRFSLTEISSSPNLIKETVRARLRAEIWHNLPKASALYRIAFGIDVRALFGADNPEIEKAIEYRHDCVHRNGRDRDGVERDVFTKAYIERIGTLLDQTGRAIMDSFAEMEANAFFGPPSAPPP